MQTQATTELQMKLNEVLADLGNGKTILESLSADRERLKAEITQIIKGRDQHVLDAQRLPIAVSHLN